MLIFAGLSTQKIRRLQKGGYICSIRKQVLIMWKIYTGAAMIFFILAFTLQRTLFITLNNYWIQAIIIGLIVGLEAFLCERLKGKINRRK